MTSEAYGAATKVPCELLTVYPSVLEQTVQDLTRSLVDKVVCELEKGESICSLQPVVENQFSDIYSVEIRRTVKITRLVRCGECKWYQAGIDIDGKPFTRCNGDVRVYGHTNPDWFCADGEREVQE